jgi:polyhydroxybutyrate depolymerase
MAMHARFLGLWVTGTLLLMAACAAETATTSSPQNGTPDPDPASITSRDDGDAGTTTPPSPPSDGGTTEPTADGAPTPDGSAGENRNMGNSAGCGKAGAATGLKSVTVDVAGTKRTYLRFVPATYKVDQPLALVLGLHGSGGTSEKARTQFGLEDKANGKAIFLYPQALPSTDPAFDGANRWDPKKDSADYAFLDAIVSAVETSYCVDRDREFATGFSLGARMTSMLGCYRGDRLRAIAPVAPGGDENTLPLSGCVGEVAIWEGWGTEDADHEQGAIRVRDYYRAANGCTTTRKATTPAGCEAFEGCRTEVPSVWCTYPLGHAWPQIGAAGVWTFFARFE